MFFFIQICCEKIDEPRLKIKSKTLTTRVPMFWVLGSLFLTGYCLLCQLGLPAVDDPTAPPDPST
jgi:hypothetical protein